MAQKKYTVLYHISEKLASRSALLTVYCTCNYWQSQNARKLAPEGIRWVQGSWSSEELSKLQELVEEKGRKWKSIGEELERLPQACRDK